MESDTCVLCGNSDPIVLERHHLKSVKQGGDDSPENIMVLCANCHKLVGARFGGVAGLVDYPQRRELHKKYIDELKMILSYKELDVEILRWAERRLRDAESSNEG